jgi:hypothetical protein
MLTKSNPEEAKRLMALAEEDVRRRYTVYEEMAREDGAPGTEKTAAGGH